MQGWVSLTGWTHLSEKRKEYIVYGVGCAGSDEVLSSSRPISAKHLLLYSIISSNCELSISSGLFFPDKDYSDGGHIEDNPSVLEVIRREDLETFYYT